MTVGCKQISGTAAPPLPAPANITSTSITVSTESGTVPFGTNISVVWTNNGGQSGTFTPQLSIGGIVQSGSPQTLSPGQTVTISWAYTVINAGTISICPIPN